MGCGEESDAPAKRCFSVTAAAVESQSHSLRFHSAGIHLGQRCLRGVDGSQLPMPGSCDEASPSYLFHRVSI